MVITKFVIMVVFMLIVVSIMIDAENPNNSKGNGTIRAIILVILIGSIMELRAQDTTIVFQNTVLTTYEVVDTVSIDSAMVVESMSKVQKTIYDSLDESEKETFIKFVIERNKLDDNMVITNRYTIYK